MGVYGKLSVASLEFVDNEKEKIVLNIYKDICEEYGIEIKVKVKGGKEQ